MAPILQSLFQGRQENPNLRRRTDHWTAIMPQASSFRRCGGASTTPRAWRSDNMNTPVVLITGALTGIGRATALAFAEHGSRIVVSGRHEEAGQALATELRALGAEAEFIRADVRHDEEVRDLVARTVARFGRLDAAVN